LGVMTTVSWRMARRRVVFVMGVAEGDGLLECTEDGGSKLLRNVIACIAVSRASNPLKQELLVTDRQYHCHLMLGSAAYMCKVVHPALLNYRDRKVYQIAVRATGPVPACCAHFPRRVSLRHFHMPVVTRG